MQQGDTRQLHNHHTYYVYILRVSGQNINHVLGNNINHMDYLLYLGITYVRQYVCMYVCIPIVATQFNVEL